VISRLTLRLGAGRPDHPLPLLVALAGGAALAIAMDVHRSVAGNAFLLPLVAALILLPAAFLVPRITLGSAGRRRWELLLRGGLAAGIVAGALVFVLIPGSVPGRPGIPFQLLMEGAALVALTGLRARPPLGRLHLPVLLGLAGAALLLVVASFPQPPIDVWVFHRDAALQLAGGGNPYAMDFPNIYDAAASERYYGPGVVNGDRLAFGYPYPPATLLAILPGQVLGGESRIALVGAILVAAACIAIARPGPLARGAAGLLLLLPPLPFLITYAWTEPVTLALLAASVAAACRAPRWTGVALGLLIASKQYVLAIVPLMLLLLRPGSGGRDLGRLGFLTVGTAALVTLPFLLWEVAPFLRAVVELQWIQPYRPDSLGLGPAVTVLLGTPAPFLLAAGAAAGALLLALIRAPWTPSGFALGSALVLLVFFALSKQAFPNYYLAAVGGILVAIGAARIEPDPEVAAEP